MENENPWFMLIRLSIGGGEELKFWNPPSRIELDINKLKLIRYMILARFFI